MPWTVVSYGLGGIAVPFVVALCFRQRYGRLVVAGLALAAVLWVVGLFTSGSSDEHGIGYHAYYGALLVLAMFTVRVAAAGIGGLLGHWRTRRHVPAGLR